MKQSLNIWKFTDGKQGHVSQSDGLIAAIRKSHEVIESVIEVNQMPSAFFMLFNWIFRKRPAIFPSNTPDFIIGAGHRTHASMLLATSLCGGKTIVLMKPSLPLRQFNFVIVPKHDGLPPRGNIIEIQGVLNAIEHVKGKSMQCGLMLIGGDSSHFVWDDTQVIKQITEIIESDKQVSWTLTTSRRTPDSFLQLLDGLQITVMSFEETDKTWLHEQYKKAGRIWVTPDSVSMVYEALSSGAVSNVFSLLPKGKISRVRMGLENLIDMGSVRTFEYWKEHPSIEEVSSSCNESTRVATLILESIS
jgi:mitochondrial fission protein ELM1